MEPPNEQFLNFDRLGNMGIPLRAILSYLNIYDAINLASTNSLIRDHSVRESRSLTNIDRFNRFNLDLFPGRISKEEIDAVYRVFPKLTKLRINMSFAEDHLLDELRKFEYLHKLSVYLDERDTNYNIDSIQIKAITCRIAYFNSSRDPLYSLLWQIRGTKILSLYNGEITTRTIILIETRDLETLKIHNSIIEKPNRLTEYLLRTTNLTYLKLTAENFLISPYPIIIANNFINGLTTNSQSSLKRFCFTLDQNRNIMYQNIRYLKNLRKLEIYYSVQLRGLNLDRIINIAGSLNEVEVIFIEYIEKYKLYNENIFQSICRKSYFYKSYIESMDKYMEVRALDYTNLRRELILDE